MKTKMANDIYMPMWPGPVVMVPMITDILLIGKPDYFSDTTWSGTKDNYYKLWMQMDGDQPQPFNDAPCPLPGAHLMWTLPYTLRKGEQSDETSDGTDVNFPLVPNRWLITRFKYQVQGADPTQGPPEVSAVIVQSDMLFSIEDLSPEQLDNGPSQYPAPENIDFPVKGVGVKTDLASFDGKAMPERPFVKAVGPGDVSWSVAYDNIKNVFSLHDDLGPDIARYNYSIIGWYDNPENDILINLPTDSDEAWQQGIAAQAEWGVGDSVADVQEAVQAWQLWQQQHGLNGSWDPSKIDLPQQAKDAIIAWHNWQQQHGITDTMPPLPKQTLCHSQACIFWQGDGYAYGTGVPNKGDGGELIFPDVAIGNNAVEAIATYMSNMVVNDRSQGSEDIPIIERALEAFQKDLLADLEADPVKVETAIHNDRFELFYGGQIWVVVRPESSKEDILGTGGQQSIPLNPQETEALIALNRQQMDVNELVGFIQTQRQELFMLSVKQDHLRRQDPPSVKEKVSQSIDAIKSALAGNIDNYNQQVAAVKSAADALKAALGDNYVLKPIDMPASAQPTDPVIMISGGQLDTKLTAPGQYSEDEQLFVRFTGQNITGIEVSYTMGGDTKTYTLGAADILNKAQMPAWNAIPKEAMDLWIESVLLDPDSCTFLASLYFIRRGVTPTPADLAQLATQIKTQQTSVWNDSEALGFPAQALKEVAGFTGVLPSPIAVSVIVKQPWSPIYMDWSLSWYPTSLDVNGALKDWKLGDIDFEWTGNNIPSSGGLPFLGRTVLNAKTAQVIQTKLSQFEDDPIYDTLPEFVITDLEVVAAKIGKIDILTQSMSGFTKQLATQLISMNSYPDEQSVLQLLGNTDANFKPVTGDADQQTAKPFFPIRSGHFSVTDLWVVDAFGQVMRCKDPSLKILPKIKWAESLVTQSPNYSGDSTIYGQLAPRLAQPTLARMDLLKNDDDNIITNSSDLTNPICGWVMTNHLDDSLIIFDADGHNQGSVIKVQKEVTDNHKSDEDHYTIRWDAAPGLNTALGAPPELENEHLQAFVNNLLRTGFDGAGAYNDLIAAIDATLWTAEAFKDAGNNQAILLGKPLAVVRAEASLTLGGNPIYNQSWIDTGQYYNKSGVYDPVNPPFMSVPFPLRVGDPLLADNGVIGYFQGDDYRTFFAVYDAAQTGKAISMFRSREQRDLRSLAAGMQTGNAFESGYVQGGHVIDLSADNSKVKLTMLVDPSGIIPVVPGSLPANTLSLPGGPVSNALMALKSTFRAGPLLLDPLKIKMPTPAEVHGAWGWMARRDVTSWNPEVPIEQYSPLATMEQEDLKLIEGWITLSNANSLENN